MKILRAELLVDIVWMAFTVSYVIVAYQYPPGGRLVPVTVGVAGIVLGAFHFLGNFIAVLRPFTHGDGLDADGETAAAVDDEARMPREGELAPFESAPEKPKYFAAIAWAVALVTGIYLIGAIWIMPIFFILYFGIRGGRWGLGIVSGAIMALITWGLFGELINLQLPPGVITAYFLNAL